MSEPQPARDDGFVQEVRSMLRFADATSMAGSLGRALMGLGVCLGVGLIVASVMTAALVAVAGSSWIGWGGWFLVYILILVPALIWHERRSRNDYLADSMQFVDPKPSSRGEYEMNRASVQLGMYASTLVWGPRALIDGIAGLRGRRTSSQRVVFDRAAVLVLDLMKVDGGIEVKKLMHPPEDMGVFGSAVDLLETHGWIGKASDGRSLWLNSTQRRKLAERKLTFSHAGLSTPQR